MSGMMVEGKWMSGVLEREQSGQYKRSSILTNRTLAIAVSNHPIRF